MYLDYILFILVCVDCKITSNMVSCWNPFHNYHVDLSQTRTRIIIIFNSHTDLNPIIDPNWNPYFESQIWNLSLHPDYNRSNIKHEFYDFTTLDHTSLYTNLQVL